MNVANVLEKSSNVQQIILAKCPTTVLDLKSKRSVVHGCTREVEVSWEYSQSQQSCVLRAVYWDLGTESRVLSTEYWDLSTESRGLGVNFGVELWGELRGELRGIT